MEKVLKKFGLNQNQIDIYLFLLKIGTSTAPDVSTSTGIDKATVYRCLDVLKDKGLVSEIVVDNIRRFNASHPSKLLDNLDSLKSEVNDIMPELMELTTFQRTNAQVELFQGTEGVKHVLNDIIRENKDYFFFGNIEAFYEEMTLYAKQWITKAELQKIKGRCLFTENEAQFELTKYESAKLIPNELASKITVWVYGNKTALFIMTNPFYTVLIENDEVAKSYEKFFDYMWKNTKGKVLQGPVVLKT